MVQTTINNIQPGKSFKFHENCETEYTLNGFSREGFGFNKGRYSYSPNDDINVEHFATGQRKIWCEEDDVKKKSLINVR